MNIPRKKLFRFVLNPNFRITQNPNSLISSFGSIIYSIIPSTHTLSHNPKYPFRIHRCFSSAPVDHRAISDQNVRFENVRRASMARKRTTGRIKPPNSSPKLVSQVIDVVTSGNGDCRSKLDSMGIRLSTRSVCEIFRVLSCKKLPGLKFFKWVRDNNRDLYCNGDVCSLMVDNCGWLDDYELMTALLMEFNKEKICLTDKAFAFLPVLDSSKAHAMEVIKQIIYVLNNAGGSSRNSGVHAMIRTLCVNDSFELARFVINITEKKLSYYAILIREKCRRGCSEEVYALINEMRVMGCDPDSRIYNYILGMLCKSDKLSEALGLLEEMMQKGVQPDAITFEVFIANLCRLGKMEFANRVLERLIHTGLVPRLSTHFVMVKGYFSAGCYDDAYKYVLDLEVKKAPATSRIYSLLARLNQRKGNIDVARKILDEMMEKGLKPNYSDCAKTVNVLRHTGGRGLARDLQERFSKFRVKEH